MTETAAPAPPVRLGFIGLGYWGATLARAAQRSGQVEVASGFARTAASRTEFADEFGCADASTLDAVLGDDTLDGVVISTPNLTHADLVCAAVQAGKHVFLEKPLTLSVDEGRRAIRAAEDAGLTLQVGHHRRRTAANRALKRLIEGGELGQVHLFETNMSSAASLKPTPEWKNVRDERPLGGMTPMGVHMLDTMMYLAGPVAQVSVLSKRLLGPLQVDDVTTVILEFASGPLGYLGTAMVVPRVVAVAAHGTGGSAWSELDGDRLYRQGIDDAERSPAPVTPVDAMAEQLVEFADCVRSGARPEVDGPTALRVVAVLEACIESQASGRTVEVAP